MSRHKHVKPFLIKLRSLYLWHRYLGVTAAAFVIILSLTGLMLNHTESLELDTDFVESSVVLDWYGIQAPEKIINFQANTHQISQLDTQLYFNQHPLPGEYGPLLGAVYYQQMIVLAVGGDLMLLTDDGEVIERLTTKQGIPSGAKKIGLSDDRFVIDAAHAIYTSDSDFNDWIAALPTIKTAWSVTTTLSQPASQSLQQKFRTHVLPMERVILDLHSGRLFGSFGVWIMDFAAVILLLLACSGVWIWLGQRRKRAEHKKRRQAQQS